jgi:Outer membrane protein beta-barrel domain
MKKTFVKIMMVSAACIALTAATTGTTQAQNGRFSVGAELGMPMGDFGDAAGIGFGGSLRYEYPIGDHIGIGLTAGYMIFGGKDGGPSWKMIPIQGMFKFYFSENQNGFYAAAHLGVHSLKYDFEYTSYTIDPVTFQLVPYTVSESVSATKLSYAPEIGYHLANIDLGLRYQLIATEGSSTSYLGVRIAYVFGEK